MRVWSAAVSPFWHLVDIRATPLDFCFRGRTEILELRQRRTGHQQPNQDRGSPAK
jgi:hypothetical protein